MPTTRTTVRTIDAPAATLAAKLGAVTTITRCWGGGATGAAAGTSKAWPQ
jgi:hypothetical protein